ncbi:MAG: hypothetical protein ACJ77B_03105 [Chloroflexota bacterium]
MVDWLRFAVALVFIIYVQTLGSDTRSTGVPMNDILPTVGVTYAVWFALIVVISAVSAAPRRRMVSRYLAEVVRQEGGLRLEIREFELTPLGRRLGALGTALGGLALVGATQGGIPPAVDIALFGTAAVLFYAVAVNPEGAGLQFERLGLTDLEVTPAGLRWVHHDGASDVTAWTQLRRVVRRLTARGIRVEAQWSSAEPTRRYPVQFRDRASGERIDLVAVAEAIRPPGFTIRRSGWLDLRTAVESIG